MIVFYFAEKGYGGVPSLIINFVKALDTQRVRVKIFNYENDIIDNTLKKNGVQNYDLIDIATTPTSSYSNLIDHDDVLVVTGFDFALRHFFKKNPRLFFYDVWADSLVQKAFYSAPFSSKSKYRSLLNELLQNNSLVFMDQTVINPLIEKVDMNISNPNYFPLSVEISSGNKYMGYRHLTSKNQINITYVGRAVKWKSNSIVKILDDVKALRLPEKIQVNLVVDNKLNLESLINLDNYRSELIEITISENLPVEELGEFILKHSDVHFGMGTAVLEGAKIGVPSVIIDYSYEPIPSDYMYTWLFETKNYCLGDTIEADYFSAQGNMKMSEIIKVIRDKNSLDEHSAKSYGYVMRNHELQTNTLKFLQLAQNASFRVRRLSDFVPYYFRVYRFLKAIRIIFAKRGV